jgi:hypothetical protein
MASHERRFGSFRLRPWVVAGYTELVGAARVAYANFA